MEEKNQHLNLARKEIHEVQPYLQIGIYLKATHTDARPALTCKTSFDLKLACRKQGTVMKNDKGFVDSFQKEIPREDNGDKT